MTIVITTNEQCEAMLKILEKEYELSKGIGNARELAKPIRWMSCTCCGECYQGRQWFNQDTGHGLGDCCIDRCQASRTGTDKCYGTPGIHYLLGDEAG
jgi:hypothetical protein